MRLEAGQEAASGASTTRKGITHGGSLGEAGAPAQWVQITGLEVVLGSSLLPARLVPAQPMVPVFAGPTPAGVPSPCRIKILQGSRFCDTASAMCSCESSPGSRHWLAWEGLDVN